MTPIIPQLYLPLHRAPLIPSFRDNIMRIEILFMSMNL